MSHLTNDEADQLQALFIATDTRHGAQAFVIGNAYEIHPNGPPGTDFPPAIIVYLGVLGFARSHDPHRGPFYHRPINQEPTP